MMEGPQQKLSKDPNFSWAFSRFRIQISATTAIAAHKSQIETDVKKAANLNTRKGKSRLSDIQTGHKTTPISPANAPTPHPLTEKLRESNRTHVEL
jgi:hypothetical protein